MLTVLHDLLVVLDRLLKKKNKRSVIMSLIVFDYALCAIAGVRTILSACDQRSGLSIVREAWNDQRSWRLEQFLRRVFVPYQRYVPSGVCPFHCADKRKKNEEVVWASHVGSGVSRKK